MHSLFGPVIFNKRHRLTYEDTYFPVIKLGGILSCMPVNHKLQTLVSIVFYTSYDIQLTQKGWVGKLILFPRCSEHSSLLEESCRLLFVLMNVFKIASLFPVSLQTKLILKPPTVSYMKSSYAICMLIVSTNVCVYTCIHIWHIYINVCIYRTDYNSDLFSQ